MNIGCNFAGLNVNLLAYADDLVLFAPSWRALQCLLNAVQTAASKIKMTFNTRKKTVCMVFNLHSRSKYVADSFTAFTLCGSQLVFVKQFKYLGHITDNTFSDDSDINREIKNLFTRTNLLCRWLGGLNVAQVLWKLLFRTVCVCLYDIALWVNYSVGVFHRLESCYVKCLKTFFGYPKYSSVTGMLLELGIPSFNTMIFSYNVSFQNRLQHLTIL